MKTLKPVLLLLLITSCGHRIHEGEIVNKWHEPEEEYSYMSYLFIGKTIFPLYNKNIDNEDWVISVKGKDGSTVVTEEFYLDKEDWERMNIGDYFNDTIPYVKDDRKD